MKRLFSACAAFLFSSAAVLATTVSATVTGADGSPYANGSYLIQLVDTNGHLWLNTGVGIVASQTQFTGSLDGNGSFSLALPANASVAIGSQWQFYICSGGGAPVCFALAQTISGTTQSLTTALSAVAPGLSNDPTSPDQNATKHYVDTHGGGGGSTTFQANGTNLTSSNPVNFLNSAAVNGLTLTFSNPSAGNVQLGLSGALTDAGLANSSVTVNGTSVSLGASTNLGQLNDTNGNATIKSVATASAVNQVTATNAATGNAPSLGATGSDANIALTVKGKGTGTLNLNSASATVDPSGNVTAVSYTTSATTPGALEATAGTGTISALPANTAGFAAPASGGTSYLFKLPATASAGLLFAASPATADGVNESALSFKTLQGTDSNILTAGTVSGTGATLCTDANGGATTTGCSSGGGTSTIGSGTATLGTSAIASAACATVVTVAATGVATTDTIQFTPNADITAVTGYAPSTSGGLAIYPYPTANNVNFKVCNPTSSSITPGAVTLNWRVVR